MGSCLKPKIERKADRTAKVYKFINLSRTISLAFNFKCYFILLIDLLILIYDKIQLSLAAFCPSGPCKNCSPA